MEAVDEANGSEIFQEINKNDMPKVMKLLERNWPTYFLFKQMITVFEKYKSAGSKWQDYLYLYGNYESGVYLYKLVIKLPSYENNYLYVFSLNDDLTHVSECLKLTNVINWQKRDLVFMADFKIRSFVEDGFKFNNINHFLKKCNMFWYPTNKPIQVKPLPPDVYLDFIDESFAEEMDKNWPYRYLDSVFVHKENLKRNFGLGILRKSDKRLICSALSNYTGGIFVLYTDPEFRGKGFACRLMESMVHEIKKRGCIPFCHVVVGNTASEAVFIKVGFEWFSSVDYIYPMN